MATACCEGRDRQPDGTTDGMIMQRSPHPLPVHHHPLQPETVVPDASETAVERVEGAANHSSVAARHYSYTPGSNVQRGRPLLRALAHARTRIQQAPGDLHMTVLDGELDGERVSTLHQNSKRQL